MYMKLIKFLKILLFCITALVALSILVLGLVGGGWSAKPTADHPFYSGDFRMIAHRGVTTNAPENTYASTEQALSLGFRGIEIDLKESKDQHFFLFHDRNGQRLLNTQELIGPQTLQDLQQMPLYHRQQATDQRIPDFESFVDRYQGKANFYLDLKRHGNDRYRYLADKIFHFLQDHNLIDSVFVGSDFLFTAYLEHRYPQLHTVFTGPGDASIFVYKWIPKKFRPDFIISYADEITPGHLQWLQKNQLMARRMLYGVNASNFQEVLESEVPILLVDYDPIMDPYLTQ